MVFYQTTLIQYIDGLTFIETFRRSRIISIGGI